MAECKTEKLVGNQDIIKDLWKNVNENKSGTKWTTLKHNGPLFPKPYQPLPASVKIKYNGRPITLDSKDINNPFRLSAEEAALMFAAKIDQDNRLEKKRANKGEGSRDPVFRQNFWNDWKVILGPNTPIKKFDKVDFTPMVKYYEEKKKKKDNMTKEEKKKDSKERKEERERNKELFGYAIIDGMKLPLGNYTVQPPGLFIGHGVQPLRGKIKKRIMPEDIILNLSPGYVPECNYYGRRCRWGGIVQNRSVEWIASWDHPIQKQKVDIRLNRGKSHWVCASDMKKFEKARNLERNIDKIRQQYRNDMRSNNSDTRQLATAVYLLDVLAIRPGTEKDESQEAGTLGLTTLKCENVEFFQDNYITVNFIGKSSIKFEKSIQLEKVAFNNLYKQCQNVPRSNQLFPRVTPSSLNGYLKTLQDDLTAKVFRTWKASSTLQKYLDQEKLDIYDSTTDKKLQYENVNIEVALALNHKRMSDNKEAILKIENKIAEYKKKREEKVKKGHSTTAVDKSIKTQESKLLTAQGNVSLSTSKVNYLDPRISVAWCKRVQLPIEKIYNATNADKFIWSMETPSTWKF